MPKTAQSTVFGASFGKKKEWSVLLLRTKLWTQRFEFSPTVNRGAEPHAPDPPPVLCECLFKLYYIYVQNETSVQLSRVIRVVTGRALGGSKGFLLKAFVAIISCFSGECMPCVCWNCKYKLHTLHRHFDRTPLALEPLRCRGVDFKCLRQCFNKRKSCMLSCC